MIKKGLRVKILVGKDKNKEGEVIEIDRQNNRAKVKDINMVKKHVKTTKEKKGGIISKENFLNLSNLPYKLQGITVLYKNELSSLFIYSQSRVTVNFAKAYPSFVGSNSPVNSCSSVKAIIPKNRS